jgi:hypothetical protein
VNSELTDDFRSCFRRLPNRIKRLARKNYQIWKSNPQHPSVDFKRVGIGCGALGLKQRDTILWFWIGPHAEYDRLLKQS